MKISYLETKENGAGDGSQIRFKKNVLFSVKTGSNFSNLVPVWACTLLACVSWCSAFPSPLERSIPLFVSCKGPTHHKADEKW